MYSPKKPCKKSWNIPGKKQLFNNDMKQKNNYPPPPEFNIDREKLPSQ